MYIQKECVVLSQERFSKVLKFSVYCLYFQCSFLVLTCFYTNAENTKMNVYFSPCLDIFPYIAW